jgi:hypothetical protein
MFELVDDEGEEVGAEGVSGFLLSRKAAAA